MPNLRPCLAICERDIAAERWRQMKLDGNQRLPDGTAHQDDEWLASYYAGSLGIATGAGQATWRDRHLAAFYGALAHGEREPLRAALVALAATVIAHVEDLDNRSGDRSPVPPDNTELTDGAVLALVAA